MIKNKRYTSEFGNLIKFLHLSFGFSMQTIRKCQIVVSTRYLFTLGLAFSVDYARSKRSYALGK